MSFGNVMGAGVILLTCGHAPADQWCRELSWPEAVFQPDLIAHVRVTHLRPQVNNRRERFYETRVLAAGRGEHDGSRPAYLVFPWKGDREKWAFDAEQELVVLACSQDDGTCRVVHVLTADEEGVFDDGGLVGDEPATAANVLTALKKLAAECDMAIHIALPAKARAHPKEAKEEQFAPGRKRRKRRKNRKPKLPLTITVYNTGRHGLPLGNRIDFELDFAPALMETRRDCLVVAEQMRDSLGVTVHATVVETGRMVALAEMAQEMYLKELLEVPAGRACRAVFDLQEELQMHLAGTKATVDVHVKVGGRMSNTVRLEVDLRNMRLQEAVEQTAAESKGPFHLLKGKVSPPSAITRPATATRPGGP